MLSKKLVIAALSFAVVLSSATPAFALQSDLEYKFTTENKDEFYNAGETHLNFDGPIPDYLLDIYDLTPQPVYNSEYGANIVTPKQQSQTPITNAPANAPGSSGYQAAPTVTNGAPQGTGASGYTGTAQATSGSNQPNNGQQTANTLPGDDNLNAASYPSYQNDAGTPSQYPITTIQEVRNSSDGSIGVLKIKKIGLTVTAYDGDTYAAMKKGVGHISSTSAWNSNVGLVGHNRGSNDYFGKLKNLDTGDEVTYTTKLGTRTYVVESVSRISETDWSKLQYTSDNRLTLLTCVEDVPNQRLCVTAVEKR